MTFGERLKILRTEKGISQTELGKNFNLGKTAISLYETNKRDPDKETLWKLADLFDVSVDYILGRSDIRKRDEEMKIIKDEEIPEDLRKLEVEEIAMSKKIKGLPKEQKDAILRLIESLEKE